jgi:hypothetical protein
VALATAPRAIAANPGKFDRAIGEEIGVDQSTVSPETN